MYAPKRAIAAPSRCAQKSVNTVEIVGKWSKEIAAAIAERYKAITKSYGSAIKRMSNLL
jgi:hypothetical protein